MSFALPPAPTLMIQPSGLGKTAFEWLKSRTLNGDWTGEIIPADPHDAKTLLRTKIRFAMPPSSLNSKKLLSVSPKDADVGLEGRGDSLYLGKYRKIKIPFQITDAKFNWKTRKIEFFLQNDGLSNTRRLRFKGILGECQNTHKARIVAHYGESELILTMGESKNMVEYWSHALDDRRGCILKDAATFRLASLDEFFDFCTRDIAERIAQHARIENRLLDLCDLMEHENDKMSVKQFLKRYVFPVCPAEWSKNKMQNIFKREFSQALKSYIRLKDEIIDLDTKASELFSNVGVTRVEPGEELNRVLRKYAIDVRTRGHHLLNCFLYLDHFEILDAMLACKGWMKECVRNKIWRPLTFRVFEEEDPDDLNSHEYLWWRTRFMKLCLTRRTACAVNFTNHSHRNDCCPGFLTDTGYPLPIETHKEKLTPNCGWTGDSYMYNNARVRWMKHGRGPGLHAASPKMAKVNTKSKKKPFVDPFVNDEMDSKIVTLQGSWLNQESREMGSTMMRVVGYRVYSTHVTCSKEGSTLHANPKTGNVEFMTNVFQDGLFSVKRVHPVKHVVNFTSKNRITIKTYKMDCPTGTHLSTYNLFRLKIDPRKPAIDPILSSLNHIYNSAKSRQNDIRFCMELPAGEYHVCSATGDSMYDSEHDLYVDDKELLPSLEKFQKIEKEKKKTKLAKSKLLSVDLRVHESLRSQFLDKKRRVTSEDVVLKTRSAFHDEDKHNSKIVMCLSGAHRCVIADGMAGLSPYYTYSCDGKCGKTLSGMRWHCAQCRNDFCFTCEPQYAEKEEKESTKKEDDQDVVRGRYIRTNDVADKLKHPDEKSELTRDGVFEFLGKKGHVHDKFSNPSFDGNVRLSQSKTYSTSYPTHSVLDANTTQTFMDGQYDGNAWLCVDLGKDRSLVLDTFMMSMKNRYNYPCCNFRIQGSNDAKDPDSWETLSIHSFDNSMKPFNNKARAVWNVGTVHSPTVYEGPPITSPWLSRSARWNKCVRKIRDIFPGISRRMAERFMTNNYVNLNYFNLYDENSFELDEIVVTMKRPSPRGFCGFYVTQKGSWGAYIYSSTQPAISAGALVGMQITHVIEGNPKIEVNCNVVVKGKHDAVVEKLVYPPKKKESKKIAYKWQWEDGTKGSGQWKNYIPKDDTEIEKVFMKKGKQCTLTNSWGTYIINLTYQAGGQVTGTQKKQASGYVRPIRRVPKNGPVPSSPVPTHAVVKFKDGKTSEVPINDLKTKTRRIPIKSKSDWDKYDAKKPYTISFVAQDPMASLLKRSLHHREEMIKFSTTASFKTASQPQWPQEIKNESYNLFGAYPNKTWARLDQKHYGYGYDPNVEKTRTEEEEMEIKIVDEFRQKIMEIDSSGETSKSDVVADGIIMSRKFTSNMDDKRAYRYFRVKQTGRNGYTSSVSKYLYLGYWELYGTLKGKTWGRVRDTAVETIGKGNSRLSGGVFKVKPTSPSRFQLQLPLHRKVTVKRKSVNDSWGFTMDSYGRINNVTDLSLEAKGIMSQCCAGYSYNQITAVDGLEIRDLKDCNGHSVYKKCIDDMMKDKTTCTLTFGYWDYFIPAKCNWSDTKMPLGFKLDPKTFRIVAVNSFGRFDGFKVGMRVTGLHFYYYKTAGSYKCMDDKRMQQYEARLKQCQTCRYVAVSVEASRDEHVFVHSSLNNFVNTIQKGGKNGLSRTVTHSKRDATRLNALWFLDTKLLCLAVPSSEESSSSSSSEEIKCVTKYFPGLGMKRDMHITRMKRSLNKVKHYKARIFALQDEQHKINKELELWIKTRAEKRDELEYTMNKDREILHCDPLETARFSYADADILVQQLASQLEDLTIDKEDRVIANVDLRYAKDSLQKAKEDVAARSMKLEMYDKKLRKELAAFDEHSLTDRMKLEHRRDEISEMLRRLERKCHLNEAKMSMDQTQYEHVSYLIAHANGHDTHNFVNASTGLRQYVLDNILIPRLASVYKVSFSEAWSIATKTEKSYTVRGILSIVQKSDKGDDPSSLMRRFPRV